MKLKHCPFCGNKVTTHTGFGGITYIYCDCGAVVSFKGNEELDKAIISWNKRTNDRGVSSNA